MSTAETIAEIALRAIVALGPDVYRIVTAADGKARLAATIAAGIVADKIALAEAQRADDAEVDKLPHREPSR